MSITRRYLGWNQPFCQVFADRLKEIASGGSTLDGCLVWVPSARAGRHLLNELFTGENGKPEGLHPPVMTTPVRYVQSLYADQPGVASGVQCLRIWKQVLCEVSPGEVKALFPFIPEENRRQWGYAIGQQLMQLKSRLAEEDTSISGISKRIQSADRDRWLALSQLESAYRFHLKRRSLQDPDDYLAGNEAVVPGQFPFTRVLVAGILNLTPRQIRYLELFEKMGISVELCLPVPAERAESLDMWGRPLPEKWNTEPVPADLLDGRIHRAFEPRELVDSVLELAGQYGKDIDALVVGSPDEALADYLIERSRLSRTPFYAPVGKSLGQTGFGRCLLVLERILHDGRLSDLTELLQNELFRNWLKKKGLDPAGLERDLLFVQQQHFLFFLGDLSDPALGPIGQAGRIRELSRELEMLFSVDGETKPLPGGIWNCLQSIAACNPLNDESKAVLNQLEEILQELNDEVGAESIEDADCWELFQYALEDSTFYPEREADQRPVSGWLELPWETAPHLVVLGLPESEIPGNSGMGPFLTPGFCKESGIRSPEMENAFHAFRLRLILESRRSGGRVDILLPERGLDDYPSQCSRFLFLATQEELLQRVHLLLDSKSPIEQSLPASFGCALTPPTAGTLTKISVTDFKTYLRNPLHYYLEKRLRWRVPESLPRELDALGFGTLAHSVLEAFNGSDSGKALQSGKDIDAFLEQILEETVSARFGTRLSLPVRIQVNSLRERLRAAVPDLAASRQEGWLPVKVEWSWNVEFPFMVEGIELHGKIDLVERNEATGLYRIIDYKTSDKGEGPRACHISKIDSRTGPVLVEESVFHDGNKAFRWIDLQLPLYQLAVEKAFGCRASCAYFNLAKTVNQVGMNEYRFSVDQLAAALACAGAVVRRIKGGEFPPQEKSQFRDSWLPWFGNDYEGVLDPSWNNVTEREGS